MRQPKTSRVELDSPTKKRIKNAIENGKPIGQISDLLDIPASTCRNFFNRTKKRGTVHNAQRSGRPSKVSDRTVRFVLRYMKQNRRASLREIGNAVDPQISASTVRRILAGKGYHRRRARKVPYLSKLQKDKRLAWAMDHEAWKLEEWRHVIWSDECYVMLGDKKGSVYVTRRPEEEFDDSCTVKTFKKSPVNVMVWACIMDGAKGPLVVLDYPGGPGGGFTAERYQEQVLDGTLWDFYISMVDNREYMYFMQDNAPIHTSKKVKRWFNGTWLPLFPHPPSSPDINPLENLWDLLKDRIKERPHPPTNVNELKVAVQEAWDSLTIEEINQYVHSMPNRVEAIIKAKGGNTKY